MAGPKLEIIAGEVTEVQLRSEAIEDAPNAPAHGRRHPKERIINNMRIFVREDNGHEDDYDFEESSVGVRQGHRVVIVRATDKRVSKPVILALHNVSNDEREENAENFALFTDRGPKLGPRLLAFAWTVGVFVIGFLLSRFVISPEKGMGWWISWPLFFSFLAFPILWGAIVLWRSVTRRVSAERARNAIRAEIAARLAAHVKNTPQTEAAKG
jgi:hypothetical protein